MMTVAEVVLKCVYMSVWRDHTTVATMMMTPPVICTREHNCQLSNVTRYGVKSEQKLSNEANNKISLNFAQLLAR